MVVSIVYGPKVFNNAIQKNISKKPTFDFKTEKKYNKSQFSTLFIAPLECSGYSKLRLRGCTSNVDWASFCTKLS